MAKRCAKCRKELKPNELTTRIKDPRGRMVSPTERGPAKAEFYCAKCSSFLVDLKRALSLRGADVIKEIENNGKRFLNLVIHTWTEVSPKISTPSINELLKLTRTGKPLAMFRPKTGTKLWHGGSVPLRVPLSFSSSREISEDSFGMASGQFYSLKVTDTTVALDLTKVPMDRSLYWENHPDEKESIVMLSSENELTKEEIRSFNTRKADALLQVVEKLIG